MAAGSSFLAALMAVAFFRLLAHGAGETPIWCDSVAALAGTVVAWGMARLGVALRERRRLRRGR